MPEFIMTGKESPTYQSLDAFTRAYIEAAFWTEEEQLTESMGEKMPGIIIQAETLESSYDRESVPSFENLALTALEEIVEDCRAFQEANSHVYTAENDAQAGHDFWLTRNRHGVGFGDRPKIYGKESAEALTQAAQGFGETSLYVGDDGLIYYGF